MQQHLWRLHVSWRPVPCPLEPCILATPAACELQQSMFAISLRYQCVGTVEQCSTIGFVATS